MKRVRKVSIRKPRARRWRIATSLTIGTSSDSVSTPSSAARVSTCREDGHHVGRDRAPRSAPAPPRSRTRSRWDAVRGGRGSPRAARAARRTRRLGRTRAPPARSPPAGRYRPRCQVHATTISTSGSGRPRCALDRHDREARGRTRGVVARLGTNVGRGDDGPHVTAPVGKGVSDQGGSHAGRLAVGVDEELGQLEEAAALDRSGITDELAVRRVLGDPPLGGVLGEALEHRRELAQSSSGSGSHGAPWRVVRSRMAGRKTSNAGRESSGVPRRRRYGFSSWRRVAAVSRRGARDARSRGSRRGRWCTAGPSG